MTRIGAEVVQARAGADPAAVSAFRALGGGRTLDAALLAQAPAPHRKA
jgi:hypothetical protein